MIKKIFSILVLLVVLISCASYPHDTRGNSIHRPERKIYKDPFYMYRYFKGHGAFDSFKKLSPEELRVLLNKNMLKASDIEKHFIQYIMDLNIENATVIREYVYSDKMSRYLSFTVELDNVLAPNLYVHGGTQASFNLFGAVAYKLNKAKNQDDLDQIVRTLRYMYHDPYIKTRNGHGWVRYKHNKMLQLSFLITYARTKFDLSPNQNKSDPLYGLDFPIEIILEFSRQSEHYTFKGPTHNFAFKGDDLRIFDYNATWTKDDLDKTFIVYPEEVNLDSWYYNYKSNTEKSERRPIISFMTYKALLAKDHFSSKGYNLLEKYGNTLYSLYLINESQSNGAVKIEGQKYDADALYNTVLGLYDSLRKEYLPKDKYIPIDEAMEKSLNSQKIRIKNLKQFIKQQRIEDAEFERMYEQKYDIDYNAIFSQVLEDSFKSSNSKSQLNKPILSDNNDSYSQTNKKVSTTQASTVAFEANFDRIFNIYIDKLEGYKDWSDWIYMGEDLGVEMYARIKYHDGYSDVQVKIKNNLTYDIKISLGDAFFILKDKTEERSSELHSLKTYASQKTNPYVLKGEVLKLIIDGFKIKRN